MNTTFEESPETFLSASPPAYERRDYGTLDGRNFLSDMWQYGARMKHMDRTDWIVYFTWSGLMVGLLFAICAFTFIGASHGVKFPAYVWNVPLGTFIFTVAISFDTIGHRTAYKAALAEGEALVHHITIAAGISSCLLLCLAYTYTDFFRIPAYAMTGLSVFYSAIDEAMHWGRFMKGKSDRIEMWSHFFIFVGHTIMMLAWCYWFANGYPGVKETLVYF